MSLTENSIALLGGGGFIGSHLTKCLIESGGFQPICVDISELKLRRMLPFGGYTFHHCDVRKDFFKVSEIVESVDVVVDLIAYANPSLYLEMPLEVVRLNLFDNLRIAEMCIKSRKPLVQFSTCEVYGKSNGSGKPFREDDTDLILGPICKQRWIYSCAKQLLERMIYAWGEEGVLEYLIIRPFNFVGPEMDYVVEKEGQGKPRVFPEFISALLYGRPLKLVDGGKNRRTFTHIQDAVEGILLCLKLFSKFRNQIVNIGTPGNEISMHDLAYLMRSIYQGMTSVKFECPIQEIAGDLYYGEGYEDCDQRIPDATKLIEVGWMPRYNLERALRETIKYYVNTYTNDQQRSYAQL